MNENWRTLLIRAFIYIRRNEDWLLLSVWSRYTTVLSNDANPAFNSPNSPNYGSSFELPAAHSAPGDDHERREGDDRSSRPRLLGTTRARREGRGREGKQAGGGERVRSGRKGE